jgi:hypothetical protein
MMPTSISRTVTATPFMSVSLGDDGRMDGRKWYVTEVVGLLGGEPAALDPPREWTPGLAKRYDEFRLGAYRIELLPTQAR